MTKQKKKRNKQYHGSDASISRPVITRVQAANRNPLSQWWFEHKRLAKPVSILGGIAVGFVAIVVELMHLFTR